jgi:V/A-type H+-transporting ATPase subunit E
MADELQALLERIQSEGLKKADGEREEILAAARRDAEALLAEAKSQAKQITDQATRDAALTENKGKEALQQAARDTMLSLREQLQKCLKTVVGACAREGLTPEAMSTLIVELAQAYLKSDNASASLEVLLNPAQLEQLQAGLMSRLGEQLRSQAELKPVAEIEGGFRLSFSGEDVNYDFTDEALAETLCEFLNPKLAELVRGL